MAKKNLIQFQAGMRLPASLESNGSEAQCRQAVFEQRWQQDFFAQRADINGIAGLGSSEVRRGL